MRLILFAFAAVTSATNYYSYAESALTGLQSFYNQTNGLWDTCGWWNGANCLTIIADLASCDGNVVSTATSVFGHTFTAAPGANPSGQVTKVSTHNYVNTFYGNASGKPKSHPSRDVSTDLGARSVNVDGWLDSCYDDNGWWALAWIAAYDVTKNQDYLDTASGIFNQNLTGAGPSPCGNGGIVWCATNPYVNAIANELYLSVAAHLANRISPNTDYVNKAQAQWTWFKNSGLINSQNLINDGLETDCTNSGTRTVWSYNQGVILGALVELNKAAADSSLITAANNIANAAIANLTDPSTHVLHDPCEPSCAPDATQFKGIFIRNLLALQQVSPSSTYQQVITANADSIWANDRDSSTNTFSVDWAGPIVNPINASTTSCAMDALVAAVSFSS